MAKTNVHLEQQVVRVKPISKNVQNTFKVVLIHNWTHLVHLKSFDLRT
jgi:hypothetical protein